MKSYCTIYSFLIYILFNIVNLLQIFICRYQFVSQLYLVKGLYSLNLKFLARCKCDSRWNIKTIVWYLYTLCQSNLRNCAKDRRISCCSTIDWILTHFVSCTKTCNYQDPENDLSTSWHIAINLQQNSKTTRPTI